MSKRKGVHLNAVHMAQDYPWGPGFATTAKTALCGNPPVLFYSTREPTHVTCERCIKLLAKEVEKALLCPDCGGTGRTMLTMGRPKGQPCHCTDVTDR